MSVPIKKRQMAATALHLGGFLFMFLLLQILSLNSPDQFVESAHEHFREKVVTSHEDSCSESISGHKLLDFPGQR